MNRHEFYDKLNKYKSLKHSQYGNGYIHRIDHYYGFNKPRYFYTQEEWDAYQREKDAEKEKRQELVNKAKEQDERINGENVRREQERIKKEKEEKERLAEERRIKAEETLKKRDAEIKDNIKREQERIKVKTELEEKYNKDVKNAEKYKKQAEQNKEVARDTEDNRIKTDMKYYDIRKEIISDYSGNFRDDFNKLSGNTSVTMDSNDVLDIDDPKRDSKIEKLEKECTALQNEFLELSDKRDKTTDKYEKQAYEAEMQYNMMKFWDVYAALNGAKYERTREAMDNFYDVCEEMGIDIDKYIYKKKPTVKDGKVTTWDDANVQTWDNGTVLNETKLYEDILTEKKI